MNRGNNMLDKQALATSTSMSDINQTTSVFASPGTTGRQPKSKMTLVSRRGEKKLEIPERIQALLADEFDHEEFQKKMELLRCRYKHAVKSELINFCYASVDSSGDDTHVPVEVPRSREFVRTLLNVVEKDKEMSDLAISLVEEMDEFEKFQTKNISGKSSQDNEDVVFQKIWENYKQSRKHIAELLDEERKEIFGEKKGVAEQARIILNDEQKNEDLPAKEITVITKKDSPMSTLLSDLDPTDQTIIKRHLTHMQSHMDKVSDEELREKEIRRGIQKIMTRLGCDHLYSSTSYHENLRIIRQKIMSLRKDVETLKNDTSKQEE